MAGVKERTEKMVFGLDIGTRSIVGTVGYLSGTKFHVIAQRMLEHDTRAMMDGQIHDITKVGEGILAVKKLLEKDTGRKLKETCVAAAGRVLQTVTQRVQLIFNEERDITSEDMSELSMKGVRMAYEALYRKVGGDLRFYCVGHTIMHYYVNDYPITNPEGHRGNILAADIIATFLPDEVVDGLYKAVELAELKVVNLTLEPIAAMHVAIPAKYRLLNIALVDVGAGTSDICITKEGSVIAYGMLPLAGDRLTDTIAEHYLVDFETAEQIKRQLNEKDVIHFEDIMGLQKTVTTKEVLEVLNNVITEMTTEVSAKIMELNGNKAVSAVFIVGGGGMIPGYTRRLASKLDIPGERVALRGKEVMRDIVFENEAPMMNAMMVTPIGICYSYYEPSNNFIFVDINGVATKLYDNGHLTISDALISAKISNEDLFPKRGKNVSYTVDDRTDTVKGKIGEPSFILLNGTEVGLHASIRNGDKIKIRRSTKGEDAVLYIKQLPEMQEDLIITAGDREIAFSKRVEVNEKEENKEYRIKDGDYIHVFQWYPLDRIASVLAIPPKSKIKVNGEEADETDMRIFDGDVIKWEVPPEYKKEPELPPIPPEEVPESQGGTGFDRLISKSLKLKNLTQEINNAVTKNPLFADGIASADDIRNIGERESKESKESGSDDKSWLKDIPGYRPSGSSVSQTTVRDFGGVGQTSALGNAGTFSERMSASMEAAIKAASSDPTAMVVEVNGMPVVLKGKEKYVYVDIFNFYQFDLTPRAGKTIVTLLNGKQAEYMGPLKQGDQIELSWAPLKG